MIRAELKARTAHVSRYPEIRSTRLHTIEFVLQTSSTGKLNALRLLAGKEDLKEQAESIVAQCPQGDLGIIKR